MVNTRTGIAALLSAIAAASIAAAHAPVRLRLADAGAINGRNYSARQTQRVRLETSQGTSVVQRTVRFRVALGEGTASEGSSVSVTAVVDSLAASLESSHGRQIIDARHHNGARFRFAYVRSGGPPAYETVPTVPFGPMGGDFPISSLLDGIFPALPDQPVAVGDSWARSWMRRQLDGKVLTESTVHGRFTVRELRREHGITIARIDFTTRAPSADAPPIKGTGTVLIGVEDGVVRQVELTETTSGSWAFGATALPFEQTTETRIALVSGAR